MDHSPLAPPILVETPAGLAAMLDQLTRHPCIAVDTESNSLYAYHERVCVIQLSIPDADYVVDALAIPDLSPLGAIFADESYEKIFHGASYDVSTLRRDYGFQFANIFDTMIAGRMLGLTRVGLSTLLAERFGVYLDKRMQRYNWGRRPLGPEELEYARRDTHYLLPLREQFLQELRRRGREQEARKAFQRVACTTWHKKPFDPRGFWRVKGALTLDDEERGILKALYILREEWARQLDRPPFKVLSDQTLIEISQHRPRTYWHLNDIPGLTGRHIHIMGRQILHAVQMGLQDPQPLSECEKSLDKASDMKYSAG